MYKLHQALTILLASFVVLFATTLAAQTDLGTVAIGGSSLAAVTVTFSNRATLGSILLRTQGVENLDFTNAGGGTCRVGIVYAADATCTVQVSFKPTRPGVRHGAAVLLDDSGSVTGTSFLKGLGTGPQVVFSPGNESTIEHGPYSPNGLAIDGSGNVFVADYGDGIVLKLTFANGTYSKSTIASGFNLASGLAMDGAGNLYVSDWGGNRVVKETLSGGAYTQSTITSDVNRPNGLAVDSSGNLYIADSLNGCVLKMTLSAGNYTESVITHCGYTGSQTCSGLTLDSVGNLYIVANNLPYVLKETLLEGQYTETSFGSGLSWPSTIAADARDNLYIADSMNNRIVKETLSGGNYIESTISSSPLSSPWVVAIDEKGNIYISDAYNGRVLKEDLSNPPSLAFASTSVGTTSSDSPKTVSVENVGNAALSFPVPSTGSNPSISTNFSLDGSAAGACPLVESSAVSAATLDPGSNCKLSISYMPVQPEVFTGALDIVDNSPNAPLHDGYATQKIALLAQGNQPFVPQVTLKTGAYTVPAGWPVTLSASVVVPKGGPLPTGTITFNGVGLPAPVVAIDANGVARWTSSALPVLSYMASATYSGDVNYQSVTSAVAPFAIVGSKPAKITFLWDNVPVTYGPWIGLVFGGRVTDADGNPVEGLSVNFSGDGLRFVPAFQPNLTNGEGLIYVYLYANKVGSMVAVATVNVPNGAPLTATTSVTGLPAPLTVRLRGALRYYGGVNPVFSVTISGLIGSDSVTALPQTTAGLTSPVGNYPITATVIGPDSGNYVATVVPATLQVRKARLNVTASSYTSQYGQTPSQPTSYSFFGFMNGDTALVVTGSPTLSTAVTSTTHVGYYPFSIGISTLSAANYFLVPFSVHSVLHVTKAPLTVNVDHLTMHRGDPMPAITYTFNGFANGDNASVVSGAPILWTDARSNTRPGTYPIYISTGSLRAHDYRMSCVRGSLTILP